MCHQTVGLVQAELERRGIVTASITMMRDITAAVGVPRALAVPFDLGLPFGPPGDNRTRVAVLRSLVALLARDDVPVLETWRDHHATIL